MRVRCEIKRISGTKCTGKAGKSICLRLASFVPGSASGRCRARTCLAHTVCTHKPGSAIPLAQYRTWHSAIQKLSTANCIADA
eukprot:3743906-Rhodomonas_salina.1